jgi:hypothetical protein
VTDVDIPATRSDTFRQRLDQVGPGVIGFTHVPQAVLEHDRHGVK